MNATERAMRQQAAWDAEHLTVNLTDAAFSTAPIRLFDVPGTAITATRGDWRNVAYYLISELGLWSELYEQERAR